jgi:hypothetical protein
MKITNFSLIFSLIFLAACGGEFTTKDSSSTTSSTAALLPGESEPAARLIFKDDNFTDITDFYTGPSTSYQCLGDVLKVHYVDGEDFNGTPTALPTPSIADDLLPTNRPAFIRNVSVDITNTYYPVIQSGAIASDNCSYRSSVSAPVSSSCADFDITPDPTPVVAPLPTVPPTPTPTPLPVPSATPSTTQYYDSHYYRVRDDWCTSQGPTISPDPEVTKEGVGGVSIDLDRSLLGANEDLLMLVTYHPLNENSGASNWPANTVVAGTANEDTDHTILKVNLVATQLTLENLLKVPQPRTWTYSNTSVYPIYVKNIATLEDPFGSLRTEQVYIPLSQNGLVDRIRIERVRGSYHLFQIDLYRLGNRAD